CARAAPANIHHLMPRAATPPVCSEDNPISRFTGMLTTPRRRDGCHQPPALVHKIGASSGECGLRSVLFPRLRRQQAGGHSNKLVLVAWRVSRAMAVAQ